MNSPAWWYYSKLYKGSYRTLLLSIVASIGQSAFVVPIAFLVRHAFDEVIPAGDLHLIALIGIGILVLSILNSGVTLWTRHLTLKTTKIAIQCFRDELVQKLQVFSRAYYDEADRGKLHTIVVEDTQRLDVMSNALVAQLVPAVFVSLALIAVLIYLNWLLFLIVLSVIPFFYIVNRFLGKTVRRCVQAYHRSFEAFSKGILSLLRLMNLTRLQTAEHFETERQRKYFDELRSTSQHMAWLRATYSLVQNTNVTVVGIVVLIVGGGEVAAGNMTLGGLLSFYAAIALLRPHLYTISYSLPLIIEGNESLNRLYSFLMTDQPRPYTGIQKIHFTGKVSLDSVSFQYKDKPVLRDISFIIHPGSSVALYGPNGSGKTTIANLILGFYRPQEGQVYADDHPYSDIDIVELRRHIGVVTQNPIIFSGTVLENMTYGYPEVDDQHVIEVARLTAAHEFIDTYPDGYKTYVGENGTMLSGGEYQRIALARALLRQPKLLILDEPTNHLDAESVRHLIRHLRSLSYKPSILIISHDVDVIREAEHIYILKEGYIESSGDFASLFPRDYAAPENSST